MASASNMFGLIVSGRLVQTNFQQIDLTKFVIDIPQADDINHVVVFLTGSQGFVQGTGCQIYFSWPDPSNTTEVVWHLLGFISNEKPSAIFKISNLKHRNTTTPSNIASSFFGQTPMGSIHNAQIGISIEPMEVILNATNVATADPTKVSMFVEFATKMLENFVNYATSFSGDPNSISMHTVQNWYQNFQRRLQVDPYFWRK